VTEAALLALPADAPDEDAWAVAGGAAPGRVLCRWDSPDPTGYGFLVLGAGLRRPRPPHLTYQPAAAPVRLPGRPDVGAGLVFVVANNVLANRDREFDAWYDDVHVPHTFEHFGFTAARRFVATRDTAPYQRLIAYASAWDRADVETAVAWAADDRTRAAAAGREPALPVSETVIAPRHAGFYRRVSPGCAVR
jgi:hypothetical protein